MSQPDRPRIVVGKGPRACERALLDAIDRRLEDLGHRVLECPLYLLVPSHSLRSHLLERLVRDRQRSVAGLSCWTLRGVAREILERAGESAPAGGEMLPVLVRRAARQERSLRDRLDHLHDGFGSLVGTVTDLLEAGLEPAHGEAICEALETEGRPVATDPEIQRVLSLVRVAIHVHDQMDRLGLGHTSSLLKRAADILRAEPDLFFPCSGFYVHGFADATGVATDLIESILLRFGGSVFLDRPADPVDPEQDDSAAEFGRRFSQRLLDLGEIEILDAGEVEPVQPVLISALGAQAEVRELGWRIRRLLDDGMRPEQIAVVSRNLGPYVSALRTHFGRLGIPYSAAGTTGPQLPSGRRVAALVEVLTRRNQVRLERWLDVRQSDTDGVPVFDLRLALFGLGASRLGELASLPLDEVMHKTSFPLPVRLGFTADEEGETDVALPRRSVPIGSLRQAHDDAAQLCLLFAEWSKCRRWSDHLESFRRLLSLLRWSSADDLLDPVHHTVNRLAAGPPGDLDIDLDEFTMLLADALGSIGRDRLGGRGGGVQILDVTEARSRTFEHLFLMGINKGVFPRTVREDPAMPDVLRHVLGREGHGVLPDLSRKRVGYHEERFLFAQLFGASPNLTLSWQVADDDNKEVIPSPLVERLLWSTPATLARSLLSPAPPALLEAPPRTAYESAVQAALWGPPDQLVGPLAAAMASDRIGHGESFAEARLSIVAEVNRSTGTDSRLGPYLGLIGASGGRIDPRTSQKLYITTLERFAECPWRTFLERLLRLETLPDPVEILPGMDPVVVGQLVHRVLECLVRERLPDNPQSLEEARELESAPIPWPNHADLRQITRREGVTVAREQGIAWDGFAAILAQVALPYLEQARQLVWSQTDGSRPVAAEMDCRLATGDSSTARTLHFKADRVDVSAGGLVLTDYKTSRRGVSVAKTQKARDRHLLAEIRRGRRLQATAYARAAGGPGDLGRYAFIRPDFKGSDETRITTLAASDDRTQEVFNSTIETLLEAWDSGVFFPRLVEADTDKEPGACDYCAVAEACLRGDSGARGRLRDWTAAQHQANRTEKAFLEAWQLASTKDRQP